MKFISSLTIFFLLSLFMLTKNERYLNLVYPSVLTLLDQSKVIVASDGIHFYDSNFEVENMTKKITFENSLNHRSYNEKTELTQFSSQDGGYILILVMDFLYIFENTGILIENITLTNIISSYNYYINTYKVENDNLHFIISYRGSISTFILHYFIFNKESKELQNDKKIITVKTNEGGDVSDLKGVTCLFLINPVYDKVLTCFYSTNYISEIQTRSFNYSNNFEEFLDLYINFTDRSLIDGLAGYISAISDNNKRKALIYIVIGETSYWMTFDFENHFSIPYKINIPQCSILALYSFQKLYFFEELEEFIILSGFNSAPILVSHFDKNFTLKKIYLYNMKNCYNHNSFGLFMTGTDIFLYTDDDESKVLINLLNDTECYKVVENQIPITQKLLTDKPYSSSENLISSSTEITTDNISAKITESEKSTESTSFMTDIPSTTHPEIITQSIKVENTQNDNPIESKKSTESTSIMTDIPSTTHSDITISQSIIVENIQNDNPIESTEILTDSTVKEISSSIQTSQFSEDEDEQNYLSKEKCKRSSEESSKYDLCTECNNEKGYFEAELPYNNHGFKECYNNDTKPINFYLDFDKKYKVCYETCLTCNKGGDEYINNCILCEKYHIKRPETEGTTNCVVECNFAYYYTHYGQYKCSDGNYCPKEFNLYIKELNKCTNDCSKEAYNLQYGGSCVKECPKNTYQKDNNICEDIIGSCIKTETIINSEEILEKENVDLKAANYAKEFSYTEKHVSYFYENSFSILIYKDPNCLDELSINMPKIDFGSCYSKVSNNLNPPSNYSIIVALIEKVNEQKQSSTFYSFYHPSTGEKIDASKICKDDEVIIHESVLAQLNNSNVDFESTLFLAQQNINIFNISDEFYTNICFNFESPNGKDVPLKDRILTYYPNITLCDDGCNVKGVDLDSMESICECKFNDIINSEFFGGNAFVENALGEITDLLTSSNLMVLKCFKNVFSLDNMTNNIGGYIIILILFFQIISTLLYFCYHKDKMIRYLYSISQYFILLMLQKNIKIEKLEKKIKEPPKRHKKIYMESEVDKRRENCHHYLRVQMRKNLLNENNITKVKKNFTSRENITEHQNSDIKEKIEQELTPKIYETVPNKTTPKRKKKRKIKKMIKNKGKNHDNKSTYSQRSESILYSSVNEKNSKLSLRSQEQLFNVRLETNKFSLEYNFNLKNIKSLKNDCENIDFNEYLKTDIDNMDYDDAIKNDQRSFCNYFCDKLKEKQIIMDTFFSKDNLRPFSIKVILLLLKVDLYFVVNGLFYNEEYISKLFHSNEEEKFFSFFPRSISRFIYTTLVGVIVGLIIDFLFVEEKKVKRIFLRDKDDSLELRYEISIICKTLKKRYSIFFSICIFISIISWYYICCFNSVYPNVKIEWIKSSIVIMIIMQLLSILSILLESILRGLSFKCQSEKLYKLKQLLS